MILHPPIVTQHSIFRVFYHNCFVMLTQLRLRATYRKKPEGDRLGPSPEDVTNIDILRIQRSKFSPPQANSAEMFGAADHLMGRYRGP